MQNNIANSWITGNFNPEFSMILTTLVFGFFVKIKLFSDRFCFNFNAIPMFGKVHLNLFY